MVSQSAFLLVLLALATCSGVVQGEHSSTAVAAVRAVILDSFVDGKKVHCEMKASLLASLHVIHSCDLLAAVSALYNMDVVYLWYLQCPLVNIPIRLVYVEQCV